MADPLSIKDSNQQQKLLSTTLDAGGNIALLHTAASVDGAGVAGPTSIARPMPVMNTAPGPAVDGSGTITTGGEAQNLFGGETPPNGYLVANNSAGTLTVCDVGMASPGGASIPIAPGVVWCTPSGYKPAGPVSIFGAVTSAAFAARRW
jgi:hypothetical protein